MLLRNHPLAKALGWLLPFCFVASFIACVNNCSNEEDAKAEILAYHNTEVLSGADECEGCQVTALPMALTQRQSNVHVEVAGDVRQIASSHSAIAFSTSNELFTARHKVISTSDPPLERLCVFRI